MKKILSTFLTILMGTFLIVSPTFAICSEEQLSDGCVSTSILGDGCSCDKEGSGVFDVLNLVVDIMTVGVAIVGIIGISFAGIQYLTAGGNEEKVKTSRRRISEIVIGVAVYILIYSLLKWLLPTFGS